MMIILLCLMFVVSLGERMTPPVIIAPQGNKWQESIVYIRTGLNNALNVKCEARAYPMATYVWTLNGTDLSSSDPRRVFYNKSTGILTTGESFSTINNDGDYQCIASNSQGSAMTPYLKLIATKAETFPGGGHEVLKTYTSQYMKLECKNIPPSVPQWEFNWEKGIMVNKEFESTVILRNNRMSVDPEGNLHFLWVEQSDAGSWYRCTGYNSVMKLEVKNTNTYELVVTSGEKPDLDPVLRYHRNVTVKAGSTARLTCIFSYFSSSGEKLIIDWYHKGVKVNNATNTQFEGRVLLISNIKVPSGDSQSGEYRCEAKIGNKSSNPASQGTIMLTVTAAPEFIKDMAPVATNIPVGKDAVFKCDTVSYNAYKKPTMWLINGKHFLGCPPHKFECTTRNSNGSSICIHEKLRCNNNTDCSDASDEMNCKRVNCHPENEKECNGVCMSVTALCQRQACVYPDFQCYDDAKCLPRTSFCNGVKDCTDGSDELACPNGKLIHIGRYVINSERTELRLSAVNMQDTMCVQCVVSNDYGTTIGDGCITVIDKITLLTPLNATYNVEPGSELSIVVDAATDDLFQNQMKFQWTWYKMVTSPGTGVESEVAEVMPSLTSEQVQISQNGKELKIIIPEVQYTNDNEYLAYRELTHNSRFLLNISHTCDNLIHNFTVVGKEIGPSPIVPVVKVASSNLWYIAIIFGVPIVGVIIMWYKYRNRGNTYPLDKKEKEAGHDPEKELKDSEFVDVNRVEEEFDELLKRSEPNGSLRNIS